MIALILSIVAAPMPGPDMCALSRPISAPYSNLLEETDIPHDFDVLHYDVSIEVFPATEILECTTGVTFESTIAGLSEIRLDLVQLAVSSVSDGSGPLTWSQIGDSLFIQLRSPLNQGETGTVTVEYSGTPWNEGPGGFGGFFFSAYVYYHMGVGINTDPPSLGRVIFPCWDHLADKASFEFHITVPDTLYAVANGDLVLKRDNPTDATTTFYWDQPQPMSTYLAAFSVSDYTVLQDSTYDWIYYFVYPWEVDDALGSFQNVNLIMDRFESIYAPYPWDTKFSYVETPVGDMEHLTEVYHIAYAINGNTNFDWLLAHEMSHHWWGDCVTEADWNDVWLSEGFATYSEAIWAESYGQASYDDYMLNDIMIPYLNSGELFPMSNPTTPAEMWSYTTYQKGASVLHMLRHIMGDLDFFEAYGTYFQHHSYFTATTDDFRDHVEAEYGDIDWFIDAWVHGWGYPIYDIDYSWVQSGPEWDVTVDLQQVQSTPTIFTMPLEFLIIGSAQDSLVVMWNDQAVQSEVFTVPFEPVSVEFDPGHYVLATHLTGIDERPQPPPYGTGTLHLAPNPAAGSTEILWSGMENSPLEVGLYDLSGRRLQGWSLSTGERELDLAGVPSGLYLLQASGEGSIRQTTKLIVR